MHYALPLGQVGTNGYITFGSSVYTEYRNGVFPGTSGTQYIVAAFWDDIDPAKGGWITYEVLQSGDFLDSVNAEKETNIISRHMDVSSQLRKGQPFFWNRRGRN